MTYEVLIDHISFVKHAGRGEDGAVWFCILGEPNENVVCEVHPLRTHHYKRQAFRLGGNGYRLDASEQMKQENKANVWGWDGNQEAPSLNPSFLAAEGRPYRMHSYVRAGKLELCGDSTVVLMNPAVPCMRS